MSFLKDSNLRLVAVIGHHNLNTCLFEYQRKAAERKDREEIELKNAKDYNVYPALIPPPLNIANLKSLIDSLPPQLTEVRTHKRRYKYHK